MTKLLLILMMVGLWSGCGEDSPTGEETREELVWTTTYDDGDVKEEYQYYHHPDTNRRMKDGWYNSYYEDGEYESVGRYKDDERDGKLVGYYESGEVKWEGNYIDWKREGKWVEYDEEGNITSERCYEMNEKVDCP